jgi:hypothetical protein
LLQSRNIQLASLITIRILFSNIIRSMSCLSERNCLLMSVPPVFNWLFIVAVIIEHYVVVVGISLESENSGLQACMC